MNRSCSLIRVHVPLMITPTHAHRHKPHTLTRMPLLFKCAYKPPASSANRLWAWYQIHVLCPPCPCSCPRPRPCPCAATQARTHAHAHARDATSYVCARVWYHRLIRCRRGRSWRPWWATCGRMLHELSSPASDATEGDAQKVL